MSPRRVVINNGGTYEGRTVEVVQLERDGCVIVKHPDGGRNLLRLRPARTNAHGVEIESQFRPVNR